jgi:hypothetical protein
VQVDRPKAGACQRGGVVDAGPGARVDLTGLAPRDRHRPVDVDRDREVDGARDRPVANEPKRDEPGAVAAGDADGDAAQVGSVRVGIGGQAARGRDRGEVRGPLGPSSTHRNHAQISQEHAPEQDDGDRRHGRDRDLAALAHGSAARATAVAWASPPARGTGSETTSVWP